MPRHATNPWLILVLICFAQFMVVLDATVVNVALPSIQKDLGLSEANLQWIVNAYTLVFGGFLLLGGPRGRPARAQAALPLRPRRLHGRLAARRPRRQLGDADRLRARCRGSAPRSSRRPRSRSSPRPSQEGAERAKALGVWAAIAIGGSAVGLIVGGALTQLLSWPWIFFINVPVGVAVFALSLRLPPGVEGRGRAPELRRRRRGHGHRGPDVARLRDRAGPRGRLDVARRRSRSSSSPRSCSSRFVVIEQRSKAPLVRLSIFRVRSLTTANVDDVPRRLGPVRDVLLQLALHPAGARVRAARGGSRVPAVHGRDHDLRRPRVAVRPARRRPARRGHRDGRHDRRDAAPRPRSRPTARTPRTCCPRCS